MAEAFGSGGDGGGGPRKMGVYDQPAQKSPIAKLLPLLIALAVLGALAYYFFLRPRPAAETAGGGADTTMSAPASRDGSMGAGGGTASPPGPRGAQ